MRPAGVDVTRQRRWCVVPALAAFLAPLLILAACGTPARTGANGQGATAAGHCGPTDPVADRIGFLYYGGHAYFDFDAPAGLQADQAIGSTFSCWQSGGQLPAGTPIYGVVGEPPERMIAVKDRQHTRIFRADIYPSGLDLFQVVRGTVAHSGPGRWTTPDGAPPPETLKRAGVATPYLPTTIAVERVLQGGFPAGQGEIEVRQSTGVDEAGQIIAPGDAPGGGIALEPGSVVILFLRSGQWPRDSRAGMPPGDYYLLQPEGAFGIQDGQVVALGDRGQPERVSLARFEAGVAETFRGVGALAPDGPSPTPIPPGPGSPPPKFAAGQTVNPAREHALDQTASIFVRGATTLEGITDPARVAAIVAALDRPLTVADRLASEPNTAPERARVVAIGFVYPIGKYVLLEYDRETGLVTSRDHPYARFSVPAPPEFVRALGLE